MLVSDLGMPGEDGYSLIRRVRALAAGFNEHLPKPLEVQRLVQSIRALATCSVVPLTSAANEGGA